MRENRKSKRININLEIEVTHHALGTQIFKARDISGTGLFVYMNATANVHVGSVLTARVLGLGEHEDSPTVPMVVAHIHETGLGLKIIEKTDDFLFRSIHRFFHFTNEISQNAGSLPST